MYIYTCVCLCRNMRNLMFFNSERLATRTGTGQSMFMFDCGGPRDRRAWFANTKSPFSRSSIGVTRSLAVNGMNGEIRQTAVVNRGGNRIDPHPPTPVRRGDYRNPRFHQVRRESFRRATRLGRNRIQALLKIHKFWEREILESKVQFRKNKKKKIIRIGEGINTSMNWINRREERK